MAENNAAEKRPNRNVKKIKSIIAMCVCVLVAFGMWVYVMSVDSPEHENVFDGVTVDLTGTDSLAKNNLAIFSGYGVKVDVTLAGKKSVVSKLSSEDIVVTADVGAVSSSGRYNIKLTVDTPAGCKLVGMSQDTVSIYVDESAQTAVDLVEQRENTSLPEGCFTDEIELPVDKVTVTGPLNMLNKVESAIVVLDMAGVAKTTSITEQIVLVDAAGAKVESPYIDYYPKEIEVEIPILKTVRVPLEVQFKNGFLSYDNTSVSVIPAIVEVTGDADLVSKGELVAPITIDEKTSLESGRYDAVVELEYADGVELSMNKAKITIVLKDGFDVREYTVAEENIKAVGANEGVKFSWKNEPMTVTILGPSDILAELGDDDLSVSFDMSPYADSNEGTVRVKADVTVNHAYSGYVLPVGQNYVNVTFEKNDD